MSTGTIVLLSAILAASAVLYGYVRYVLFPEMKKAWIKKEKEDIEFKFFWTFFTFFLKFIFSRIKFETRVMDDEGNVIEKSEKTKKLITTEQKKEEAVMTEKETISLKEADEIDERICLLKSEKDRFSTLAGNTKIVFEKKLEEYSLEEVYKLRVEKMHTEIVLLTKLKKGENVSEIKNQIKICKVWYDWCNKTVEFRKQEARKAAAAVSASSRPSANKEDGNQQKQKSVPQNKEIPVEIFEIIKKVHNGSLAMRDAVLEIITFTELYEKGVEICQRRHGEASKSANILIAATGATYKTMNEENEKGKTALNAFNKLLDDLEKTMDRVAEMNVRLTVKPVLEIPDNTVGNRIGTVVSKKERGTGRINQFTTAEEALFETVAGKN